MENNQKPKLGAGIITLSVIQLVLYAIVVFGLASTIIFKDTLQSMVPNVPQIDTSAIIISLIITIILVIGIILILCKNQYGIYTYYTCVVINFIYGIIMNGFTLFSLLGFILPALLAYFLFKKKEIFGFTSKAQSLNL